MAVQILELNEKTGSNEQYIWEIYQQIKDIIF